MKLSVIIVNYNVKYYLEQCLLSVIASNGPAEIEIFVVDNHSSDGSVNYLKEKFPSVTLIPNQANLGFSKASNQAIRQVSGDYILLLNPDTVVGEHTLAHVCQFMEENPNAGGVGVKMIDGSGQFLLESKRGFPSPWNSLTKILRLSNLFPHWPYFSGYHLRYLNENQIHTVDVLAGAFMCLRKTTLEQIGYLDEDFFMYGEDIDLSYRITLGGYQNYYLPEKIIHYKGESTKKNIRYVKLFYQAMLTFFQKHYPNSRKWFSILIHCAIYIIGAFSAIEKLFLIHNKKRDSLKKVIVIGEPNEAKKSIDLCISQIPVNQYRVVEPCTENLVALLSEKKTCTDVIFCVENLSYEAAIHCMDQCRNKKINYWFFHPKIPLLISSNTVIS